jgi:TusA-related sulfurtransferase
MTVAELIKKLEKMQQDAIVEVAINAPFFNKELGTFAKEVNKRIITIR